MCGWDGRGDYARSHRSRVRPDAFFLSGGAFSTGQLVPAAVAGTKGTCCPVLMGIFVAMLADIAEI